uniref:Uncharacterized protein n=1 Tax=Tanacetum cinerariifolium TaxID=118510 RepID=A0A6L2MUI2_TANCI|nr:hypothetical protein [Tanacetum cinerariifolium]
MKETKIETPPLDQTEGQKERNQVKMLSHPEIQSPRKRSLQVPLKTLLNLNISLSASMPMQRSQVILLKTQACNKIKSSSRETMMNNLLTRRLPKLTGSRNPSDLQLLILIRGPKFQRFYGYASNLTSSKDVYSRRRIIAVTIQKIMKKYDYDHLEDNKVSREDQNLYTFKEGDFKRHCLQDIEDMLLLLIQKRLTNLTIDERNKTAYTSYSDPHGIIYVDQYRRKRLMRTDELHKFSDDTLNDVRSALHDIAAGIRM